jgi:hypothetical protein
MRDVLLGAHRGRVSQTRRALAELRDRYSSLDADGSISVHVSVASLTGLKFSATLPMELARRTIATRLVDQPGARVALNEPRVCLRSAG